MKFLLWKFSVFDFMTVNTEEYLRQEFKLSLDRESSIFWVTCDSIAPLHENKNWIKNFLSSGSMLFCLKNKSCKALASKSRI